MPFPAGVKQKESPGLAAGRAALVWGGASRAPPPGRKSRVPGSDPADSRRTCTAWNREYVPNGTSGSPAREQTLRNRWRSDGKKFLRGSGPVGSAIAFLGSGWQPAAVGFPRLAFCRRLPELAGGSPPRLMIGPSPIGRSLFSVGRAFLGLDEVWSLAARLVIGLWFAPTACRRACRRTWHRKPTAAGWTRRTSGRPRPAGPRRQRRTDGARTWGSAVWLR